MINITKEMKLKIIKLNEMLSYSRKVCNFIKFLEEIIVKEYHWRQNDCLKYFST